MLRRRGTVDAGIWPCDDSRSGRGCICCMAIKAYQVPIHAFSRSSTAPQLTGRRLRWLRLRANKTELYARCLARVAWAQDSLVASPAWNCPSSAPSNRLDSSPATNTLGVALDTVQEVADDTQAARVPSDTDSDSGRSVDSQVDQHEGGADVAASLALLAQAERLRAAGLLDRRRSCLEPRTQSGGPVNGAGQTLRGRRRRSLIIRQPSLSSGDMGGGQDSRQPWRRDEGVLVVNAAGSAHGVLKRSHVETLPGNASASDSNFVPNLVAHLVDDLCLAYRVAARRVRTAWEGIAATSTSDVRLRHDQSAVRCLKVASGALRVLLLRSHRGWQGWLATPFGTGIRGRLAFVWLVANGGLTTPSTVSRPRIQATSWFSCGRKLSTVRFCVSTGFAVCFSLLGSACLVLTASYVVAACRLYWQPVGGSVVAVVFAWRVLVFLRQNGALR